MVPLEYILASIGTYPFSGERVFSGGYSEGGQSASKTWQILEAETGLPWPGYSIDELIAIRDQYWCGYSDSQGDSLTQQWRGFCSQVLSLRGPRAIPTVPTGYESRQQGQISPPDSRARTLWRWLTFCVPEDWLLAGAWSKTEHPVEVQIVHRQLAKSMERHGFAETHLHLGAAVRFSDLWIATMRTIGKSTASQAQFNSTGGALTNGTKLADWLLRAAIVRVLLAKFLSEKIAIDDFPRFVELQLLPMVAVRCGKASVALIRIILDEVCSGQLQTNGIDSGPVYRELQALYRQLVGPRPFQSGKLSDGAIFLDEESLEQFRLQDPIRGYFQPNSIPTEMLYWDAAFSQLTTAKNISGASTDRWSFQSLFWQSIRIRNIFYRHLVLRPMVPGMSWFIRSYNRIAPCTAIMSERAKLESAADVSGRGKGLVSLEVRAAYNESSMRLRQFIESLAKGSNSMTQAGPTQPDNVKHLSEVALVLHFIRERGPRVDQSTQEEFGIGSYADPEFSPGGNGKFSGFRYGFFFQKLQRQARAAVRLMQENPEVLRFFRGVDCCNDEASVPLWVVAPHMNRLRAVSRHIASNSSRNEQKISPLHATVHVGEDFAYPLTGLRRIGEVLERLSLDESDRLGHALALGIDLTRSIADRRQVAVPLEDRLFDLLWERRLYRQNKVTSSGSRFDFVEEQILQLSKRLFKQSRNGVRIDDVDAMVDLLFSLGEYAYADIDIPSKCEDRWREFLRQFNYPIGSGEISSCSGELQLVSEYLCSAACFKAARQTLWIDLVNEKDSMSSIQAWMLEEVANRRLIIEVNPSSNLIVGDLSALVHHPIVRYVQTEMAAQTIQVTVGSDDPLVFGCSLPEEYALLHDALADAGNLQPGARINDLMNVSLDAAFSQSPPYQLKAMKQGP